MDRLHALMLAGAALVACDGTPPADAPPPPSRVQAVQAAKPTEDPLAGFCDVTSPPGAGPRFAWPPVDGAPKLEAGGFHWVNVWATWCKPCIEEMPMIEKWRTELGGTLSTHFLSVDEDVEQLKAFRAAHPELPDTLHLGDPEALGPWMASLGLDSGAGLPVHVFVEPTGHIRCARSGAVTRSHYSLIRDMLD